MRFDRVLTLWLFRWLPRSGAGRIPVLMYHSISDDPENGIRPYYRVATSPQKFAAQMQWLSELDYQGVSVEEAFNEESSSSRRRVAVITFDDGFRDFYDVAWPVLKKHRFSATMYLPTAFISQSRKTFHDRYCMTWGEVREMRREGIRFGSHTVNHPKLYEISNRQIRQELSDSKARIEDELSERIASFAYPYAFPQEDKFFVGWLNDNLCECGFTSCATTIVGRQKRLKREMLVKRLPVNECDDRALFAAKLSGAYDWFGVLQSGWRRVKRKPRPTALSN